MKHFFTRTLTGVVALGLAMTVVPASAQASENAESIDTILSKIAPETRQNLQQSNSASRFTTQEFVAPASRDEPIAVNGSGGEVITIDLPQAVSTTDTNVAGTPVTIYDGGDDSMSVPLPKNDGSVQVLTVLSASTAPTGYS